MHLAAFTDVDGYHLIKEDDLGDFDQVCQYCGSLNFSDERNNGEFSLCCHKGKVNLPQFDEPPPRIKKLFTEQTTLAKNFRENIRLRFCIHGYEY